MVGHGCMERGGHIAGARNVRPNSMEKRPRKTAAASSTSITAQRTQWYSLFQPVLSPLLSLHKWICTVCCSQKWGLAENVITWLPSCVGPGLDMPERTPAPVRMRVAWWPGLSWFFKNLPINLSIIYSVIASHLHIFIISAYHEAVLIST